MDRKRVEQDAASRGLTFYRPAAFWLGVIAVIAGVLAHLPMYLMGRHIGYRLVGMPMDATMVAGMAAIIVGLAVSLYGLVPPAAAGEARVGSRIRVAALDDVPLGPAHYRLLLAMALAVTIDVMKPTALAFVMPGMALNMGSSRRSYRPARLPSSGSRSLLRREPYAARSYGDGWATRSEGAHRFFMRA